MPSSIKKDIKNKKLTTGHAISLLSLKSKAQMLAIANRIVNKKLSVRNAEEIVSKINASFNGKIKTKKTTKPKILNELESKLIHKYGTKVSILFSKSNKGKIIFEYYTKDDLDRILSILNK